MCRWYKEGNTYPLEAETRSGTSRDSVTMAVLMLTPSRGDDGAAYRCVVWNRAMPEGSKLDARVTLSVNCKSPTAVAQLRGSHDLIIDTCIAVYLY
jgi:echinoid protein